LQSELASTQVEVNKLVNDCLVQRKQGEADEERIQKLENHIRTLKEDQ